MIGYICIAYTFPMLLTFVMDAWHSQLGVEAICTIGAVACLLASAIVCREHFPERWLPGTFDYFGSHAIMHILVFAEYLMEWAFIHHLASKLKAQSIRPFEG